MKKTAIILFIIILPLLSCETLQKNKNHILYTEADFNLLLKASKLKLIKYDNYSEIPILKNEARDVEYFKALKHKEKDIEIRLTIFPTAETSLKSNKKFIRYMPNKIYRHMTIAVLSNIAGNNKNIKSVIPFQKKDVKAEFNAHWGITFLLLPGNAFGSKYKYVMGFGIFKENAALAYVFFLANDLNLIKEESRKNFYNIHFI